MTRWIKILLAITIIDIIITCIGANQCGLKFEFNPLMRWFMEYNLLLFVSVKLLIACGCIKLILIADYDKTIFKHLSIAYAIVLLSAPIIDLIFFTLPK